jgi:hypothetical protein
MKNTKQTAVEWIEHQVEQQGITHYFSLREILEQAKEMEKQQRMSDFTMGITNANRMEETKDAEQWYNETYGGNK